MSVKHFPKPGLKPCRGCSNPTPNRNNDWLCVGCSRLYRREWREKQRAAGRKIVTGKGSKEWWHNYTHTPEFRAKSAARAAFRRAVASGRVEKQPCEVCGNIKSEGHHPDYSQRLKVIWLCKRHHGFTRMIATGGQQ